MKAKLVLADGSVYEGKARGATGENLGEVVFTTGMTGYQEVLTDPSFCGQIVTMTYPLIGNYGVSQEDSEADRSYVRGFIVRQLCDDPNNWRATQKLDEWLREKKIICLEGIDTRALTRRLRYHGTMGGVISTFDTPVDELVKKAESALEALGHDQVKEVSTSQAYHLPGDKYRVVVIDYGVKRNTLRVLQRLGCHVIVVPCQATAAEILALNPDGVLLSNGPGDPKDVPFAIQTVRELLAHVPIMGICLGHQIMALALGGDTYKLKFGHRGANHPVKNLVNGRVYITSQNHGYAVDEKSLPLDEVTVTHRNLNDGTVEGIDHKYLPAFSVQYHPEAAPGPDDSGYLFDKFIAMMEGRRQNA